MFLYLSEKTTAWIGINSIFEERLGGDLMVIDNKADNVHQYFEQNNTTRISSQVNFTHQFNEHSKLNFKNTIGSFNRKIALPNHVFNGQQVSSFSEFSYYFSHEKSEWITGINLWTDSFKSLETPTVNYNLTTFGVFAQHTLKANDWFSLETGIRLDANAPQTNDKGKGVFILPRINALLKINEHFTSRIGGGLGYKMPTIFSEEAEERGFQGIQPIVFNTLKAEQSYGGNADINYKTQIDDISISINQLFFYTYLDKPLILQGNHFENANGYIDTKGFETNLKIRWENLHFFAGYTYTDANKNYNSSTMWQSLTSRHRLNTVLMWEAEGQYRIGLEGLYVSEQRLADGTVGRGYMMFGFLAEKMWEHFNIFVNAENFTDQRQTRWDTIYTGTITNPTFRSIYAPTDGIIINAGVKIKL